MPLKLKVPEQTAAWVGASRKLVIRHTTAAHERIDMHMSWRLFTSKEG